jgi:hypothetical protein
MDRFAAHGVAHYGGYESYIPMSYHQGMLLADHLLDHFFLFISGNQRTRLADIQGVRYYLSVQRFIERGSRDIGHFGGMTVFECAHAWPRAFLAYRVTDARSQNLDHILARMLSNPEVPSPECLVDSRTYREMEPDLVRLGLDRGPAVSVAGRPDAGCTDINVRPNEVTMTTDSAQSSVLILTDGYWPGWTATIDGIPARAWPIHGGLHRGVLLPPGAHKVAYIFSPTLLWLGLGLSGGTLSLVLAAFLKAWSGRPRGTPLRTSADEQSLPA